MQKKRGLRFVDATLDRAGIVPDADAALAQRMQKPQAERDLFECTCRDRAHENAIGQAALETRNVDAAFKASIESAMGQRRDGDASAHCFERTNDAARVPFAAPFLNQKCKVKAVAE